MSSVNTKDLLRVLHKNNAVKTIIPSLNLWIFYVMVCLISWAVFSVVVAGLVFVFGIIIMWAQTEETKEALRQWWISLPLLKFHGVCLLIELGAFLYLVKFSGISIISGILSEKKNNEQ